MSRSSDIERLIVRHLDGEITADEDLELSREIIRNPEARRMLEEYQRVDVLAGASLRRALSDDGDTFELKPVEPGRAASPRRALRYHRAWLLVSGAIAAAVLAIVIPRPVLQPSPEAPAIAERLQSTPTFPANSAPANRSLMRHIGSGLPHGALPRVKRDTGREVFGVMGDDGSIYWIEVDRIRTIRRPRDQSADPWTNGAL